MVRLSRVWGGPEPVLGILAMVPYPGTRRYMCTRVFATSGSVSDNAKKNCLSPLIPSVVPDRYR